MTPTPRARLSPRLLTLLDLLLLAALCALFFWRAIPAAGADYRGFADGDFSNQFYAFASYRAERLAAGELPLWSPYALGGHPFLGDIQSAVYYPPALLTVALTRTAGFSYSALQLEAILHFPVAAFGMYFLARRLTRSRLGAWVAAVAFTFSAYLTGYPVLQLAILETVAWLPWIILALDHAAEQLKVGPARRAVAPVIAAGLLFGVSLLAGHPQSALLVGYAALAFAVFRAVPLLRRRSWQGGTGVLAALLAFLPLGALIAAAQLLPSLEYMRLSTRAGLGIDAAGGGFTPYDLIQFFLPQVGAPVAALYIGALGLGLAVFALLSAARRSAAGAVPRDLAAFFGGLAGLGILLSFGKLTPVYQLAYLALPGWRLFRGQERLALWVIFGLAMLAGLGAAALERERCARPALRGARGRPSTSFYSAQDAPAPRAALDSAQDAPPNAALGSAQDAPADAAVRASDSAQPLVKAFLIAAALALVFTAACFIGYQAGNAGLWGFTAAGVFLTLMLAAAGAVVWSGQPALFVALMVVDLFTLTGGQHAGTAESAQPFPPGAVFAAVQADPGAFRTFNEAGLPENIGYGYRFEEVNGASPLRLAAYERLLQEAPRPLLWRLMGVKYVFTWRQELEVPAERLAEQRGADGKPVYVYRLAEPAPLARLNGRFSVEPNAQRQLDRVLAPGFDPAAEVVLSAAPEPAPDPACSGTIEWVRRTPEFLALNVNASAPCALTVSEIAYPGWQAAIDGGPARALTADAVLRAVAVPAGAHSVTFTFAPRPAAALITLIALLIAAAAFLAAQLLADRSGHAARADSTRSPSS